MSRRALQLAALVALALGLAGALAGGALWGAFSSRAAANAGDSIAAAPDFAPPHATATTIAMKDGSAVGAVRRGSDYYVYAEVVDSGNPASGVAAVSADVGAITAGRTAVPLGRGSYSVGGVAYNRRSAALTASKYLPEGTSTYSLTMTDAAGNSAREEGFEVAVDNVALAAADIQTENHGRRAGRPEEGDTIIYSFSEAPDPGSILAGWDGSATGVVVHLEDGWSEDTVTVYDEADAKQLPLGTVRPRPRRLHEPGPHLRRLGDPLDDGAERRRGDDHPRAVVGQGAPGARRRDDGMAAVPEPDRRHRQPDVDRPRPRVRQGRPGLLMRATARRGRCLGAAGGECRRHRALLDRLGPGGSGTAAGARAGRPADRRLGWRTGDPQRLQPDPWRDDPRRRRDQDRGSRAATLVLSDLHLRNGGGDGPLADRCSSPCATAPAVPTGSSYLGPLSGLRGLRAGALAPAPAPPLLV